jgi:hypothetical protein
MGTELDRPGQLRNVSADRPGDASKYAFSGGRRPGKDCPTGQVAWATGS